MADETRYHINPESGRPNICRATGKRGCKYKNEDGTEPPHFPSKEAAQAHQNEKDEAKYGAVATVSKKPKGAEKQSQGEEGPGTGISSEEAQRAVDLIEADIDTPEYNAAREKLRESVSDYHYQSRNYTENEARGGMDLSDDAAELRHVTQVVKDDMAKLEELKNEPQISDEQHAENLSYLRSFLDEGEEEGSGSEDALRIVSVDEMKEFHAQGEKEAIEATKEYLDAEERAVNLENKLDESYEELESLKYMRHDLDEDAKVDHSEELENQRMEVESKIDELEKSMDDDSAEYNDAINQLNEARERMYQAQKKINGSFEQQQQMAEMNSRIESFQEEVNGLQQSYEDKAEMKRYVIDQMTSMEEERKGLIGKPSRTPIEEVRLREINRNLSTVRDEFPEVAREAYKAQRTLVEIRNVLEDERWRKTQLQGEIYQASTGNVTDYASTEAEEALERANTDSNTIANELEDLDFRIAKANQILGDMKINSATDARKREIQIGQLSNARMSRMVVESSHMDAVEKQYAAQEALYAERGWR